MLLLVSGEWMEWFNYPGLEVWKFLNLAIFTGAAIYVLRRRISAAFLARGEAIRQEILAAQNEREQAMAKVAEADAMLSRVDQDVRAVREQAQREAASERERLADATAREMEKLKQQASREMESADKLARKELRQYLAKRSIELARETIQDRMKPDDDAQLIKENIGDLRRTTV